jgi:predicted PhzF superfamily epimerase YddE/YHI9
MLIKNLRCFSAKDKRSGNPAIVIQDFEGHTHEMQQFAKNSQAPACAFVFKGESIRFFYPEMESELCIHAALCAAKVLFAQNPSQIMQLKIKSEKVLNFKKANKSYYIKTATEPSANGAIYT